MNCFEILHISSDSDIKTIKKAYAKLVKIHNPEDDPEGYQKVRKAYDEALKIAKIAKKKKAESSNEQVITSSDFHVEMKENKISEEIISKSPVEDISNEKINSKEVYNENIINEEEKPEESSGEYKEDDGYTQYKKQNLKELSSLYENGNKVYKKIISKAKVDSFIHRLTDIYANINTRIDESEWEKILKDTIELDVETYSCLYTSMVYFLFTHQYMPHKIYILLNDYFGLKNDELKLKKNFSSRLVEELLYRIETEDYLSYDFLENIPSDSLDEYLNLRELAYKSVESNNYKGAENYIKYAYKIYADDPELLKINARLNYLNFDYKEAKFLLKEVLKINKDDDEAKKLLKKLNKFNYIDKKCDKFIEKHRKTIYKAFKYAKSFFYGVVILVIICFVITNIFDGDAVSHNGANNRSSEINHNKMDHIKESSQRLEKLPVDLEYADSDAEFLISIINKSQCKIKVQDIQATDYYMLKESIEDKDGNKVNCIFIDDTEKNDMKHNIKSRVYIGKVSDNIVLFTDYDKNRDVKDEEVKVIGKKIDDQLYSKIKKDNISYGKNDDRWFPDCIFVNVNDDEQKDK